MAFTPYGSLSGKPPIPGPSATTAAALSKGDLVYLDGSDTLAKAAAGTDGPLFVMQADAASGATGKTIKVDEDTLFRTTNGGASGSIVEGKSYALDATTMDLDSAAEEVDIMDIRIEVVDTISSSEWVVLIHPGQDTTA